MKHTHILWAATALVFGGTAAQGQHRQNDHHDRQDQHGQASPQIQSRPRDGNLERRAADAQRREVEKARSEQARAEEIERQHRSAQEGVQRRELEMRQREEAAARERARQIEERDRLIQAQRRAEANRVYVIQRNYRPGYDYRYRIGGVYRETNQYGVNLLRQAVDVGYRRGYEAGLRDFRDGVAPDYRRAFDYQNGTYGYSPDYIPESDYSYYFREGFQRGYDDAYWNRMRYGTYSNGRASILGDVLAGILGLTVIH
jgi:hypothetical protein